MEKKEDEKDEYEEKKRIVKPKERIEKLLMHSISFLTKRNAHREVDAQMVMEEMPKLIITHVVSMADAQKHISIIAIRRLINFIRLFHLCIELVPGVMPIINEMITAFKEEPEKRGKAYTPNLGELLAVCLISDNYSVDDIL